MTVAANRDTIADSSEFSQREAARGFETIEVFTGLVVEGQNSSVRKCFGDLAEVMKAADAHEGCGAQAILDVEAELMEVDQAKFTMSRRQLYSMFGESRRDSMSKRLATAMPIVTAFFRFLPSEIGSNRNCDVRHAQVSQAETRFDSLEVSGVRVFLERWRLLSSDTCAADDAPRLQTVWQRQTIVTDASHSRRTLVRTFMWHASESREGHGPRECRVNAMGRTAEEHDDGSDAKIPDLWRISALLETCKMSGRQMLLCRDALEKDYQTLKTEVTFHLTHKIEQPRGSSSTSGPMSIDNVERSGEQWKWKWILTEVSRLRSDRLSQKKKLPNNFVAPTSECS